MFSEHLAGAKEMAVNKAKTLYLEAYSVVRAQGAHSSDLARVCLKAGVWACLGCVPAFLPLQ
jgi:hypothetical protein